MRGFIFSLEALATIAIVLLVCSIFFYTQTNQNQSTTHLEIKNQSTAATSIYFNLPEKLQDPNAETQYCTKITNYYAEQKQLFEKTICGGSK